MTPVLELISEQDKRLSAVAVKALRLSMGLTQRQFAQRLDLLAYMTISNYERGVSHPECSVMQRLVELSVGLPELKSIFMGLAERRQAAGGPRSFCVKGLMSELKELSKSS